MFVKLDEILLDKLIRITEIINETCHCAFGMPVEILLFNCSLIHIYKVIMLILCTTLQILSCMALFYISNVGYSMIP